MDIFYNKKYNDVINKLQHYIICESFVKHIKQTIYIKKNVTAIQSTIDKSTIDKKPQLKNTIYYPKSQDMLYWIFYIMQNGVMDYEYNKNKHFLLEKEDKIKYVEQINKHKEIIKRQKIMSLANFENDLIYERKICINTFLNLCAIQKINVIVIKNKIYYELLTTDNNEIFIVYNTKYNQNSSQYEKFGVETCLKNDNTWNNITTNLIQTNNIMSPIKSISYYKLNDLIKMCDKFGLPVISTVNMKNKKKSELYEQIIQTLS
jgi:hypothetical protein